MGGKDLLLLLEDWAYFFLEGEKLFFVVTSHCFLHCWYVLLHLLLVLLLLGCLLILYLFCYPVILFGGSLLGLDHRFLDGGGPASLLFVPHSDCVFFLGLAVDFFGRGRGISRLVRFLLPIIIVVGRRNAFGRHFVVRIFRLQDLLLILQLFAPATFLLLDIPGTLYLMHLLLGLNRSRLWFGLRLVVFPLVDLVVFFAHFRLVFQPFCVAEGIERVVSWWAAGGDAGDHDYFADLVFAVERITED